MRPPLFEVHIASTGGRASNLDLDHGAGSASYSNSQASDIGFGQTNNSTRSPFQDRTLFTVPPGPSPFNPPGPSNGAAVPITQPQFDSVATEPDPDPGFAEVSDKLGQPTPALAVNTAQDQQSSWATLSPSQNSVSEAIFWVLDGQVIRINLKDRNGKMHYRAAKCCPGRRHSLADIGIANSMRLSRHPIPHQRRMNQTLEKPRKYFCFLDITDVENVGPIERRLCMPLGRVSNRELGVIIELGYEAMAQLRLVSAVGVSRGKSS
ncbi:hypothetical protein QQZ08_000049 [Neonectria magnoliae]|uniref:Uncharacterized protein n=1 Tax=Neonectria magnoliae TaxID=2732573 RepID=A0ABR1IHP9_9HYPO